MFVKAPLVQPRRLQPLATSARSHGSVPSASAPQSSDAPAATSLAVVAVQPDAGHTQILPPIVSSDTRFEASLVPADHAVIGCTAAAAAPASSAGDRQVTLPQWRPPPPLVIDPDDAPRPGLASAPVRLPTDVDEPSTSIRPPTAPPLTAVTSAEHSPGAARPPRRFHGHGQDDCKSEHGLASASHRPAAAVTAAERALSLSPPARRRQKKVTRKTAELLQQLAESLQSMSAEERGQADGAARAVQQRWREVRRHVVLIESLRSLYSQPDLEKARKHAESFLPKDRHGLLFPLATPFKSFHSLGCGVALYMYVVHWWSALFFVLALVTMSMLLLHIEGDGLAGENRNIYTIHSLGNSGERYNASAALLAELASAYTPASAATNGTINTSPGGVAAALAHLPPDGLPAAFGAVEILVSLLLTWFMFWQSNQITNLSRRITHHETTAANYTVMVGRMPTERRPTAEIAEHFGRWGDVVHVGVSYNHRDLILAARERAEAREALHAAHVQWYLAKVGSYPPRKRERAATTMARAKRRLWRASEAVRTVSALELRCAGFVFITYDTVDAAQAAIAAAAAEKTYFRGAGPLQVSMAPEPEDIIWENLQYSRSQRAQRLVLSTAIILTLTVVNTAAISVAMVWQSQTLQSYTRGGDDAPDLFTLGGIMVVSLIVVVVGYVSIIAAVPLLAHKLERWHQFANREVIMVVRLALFQVRTRSPLSPPPRRGTHPSPVALTVLCMVPHSPADPHPCLRVLCLGLCQRLVHGGQVVRHGRISGPELARRRPRARQHRHRLPPSRRDPVPPLPGQARTHAACHECAVQARFRHLRCVPAAARLQVLRLRPPVFDRLPHSLHHLLWRLCVRWLDRPVQLPPRLGATPPDLGASDRSRRPRHRAYRHPGPHIDDIRLLSGHRQRAAHRLVQRLDPLVRRHRADHARDPLLPTASARHMWCRPAVADHPCSTAADLSRVVPRSAGRRRGGGCGRAWLVLAANRNVP